MDKSPSRLIAELQELLKDQERARARIDRMLSDPDAPEISIRVATDGLSDTALRLHEVRAELNQLGITF